MNMKIFPPKPICILELWEVELFKTFKILQQIPQQNMQIKVKTYVSSKMKWKCNGITIGEFERKLDYLEVKKEVDQKVNW